jgi:hypothetical protein
MIGKFRFVPQIDLADIDYRRFGSRTNKRKGGGESREPSALHPRR